MLKPLQFQHRWQNLLLLLVIPVVTFWVMNTSFRNTQCTYMYGGDPMYAYLLNGLNLAKGNMDIGHTDHPGTTVQTYGAIMIRIVYAVSGEQATVADDVMADPEKYLFAGRFTQIVVISFLLVWLGASCFRITNNLSLSVYLQSSVLLGVATIMHSHAFAPEGMLIVGGIFMIRLCVKMLFEDANENSVTIRNAVMMGVICGFMLISKLPGLFYMLIPFFLLQGIKKRLITLGAFIATACILVLPAINRIQHFFDFLFKAATHTGIYGNGEEKMFESNEFINNFKKSLEADYVLYVILLLTIPALIHGWITYRKADNPKKFSVRMMTGLFFLVIMNILLACKQYNPHYLIASLMLLLLLVFLLFRQYSAMFNVQFPSFVRFAATAFVFLLLPTLLCARFYNTAVFNFEYREQQQALHELMFNDEHLPRVYDTPFPAGIGPEPALYFGSCFSGRERPDHGADIVKYYPNGFISDQTSVNFMSFGNPMSPELLVTKFPRFWFYHGFDSTGAVIRKNYILMMHDSLGPIATFTRMGTAGAEKLYLVEVDTARAKKLLPLTREIVVDFEQSQGDTLFLSNDSTVFMTATLKSVSDKSFSGKHSLFLEHANIFSGVITMNVKPTATYEFTAWKYGDSYQTYMVANGGPNTEFYKAGVEFTGNSKGEWNEIVMRFTVPADFPFETLNFFIYNDDMNERPVWIDDFRIREYTPVPH